MAKTIEQIREYRRRHYAKNAEKIKEASAKYRKANPLKRAQYRHAREARKWTRTTESEILFAETKIKMMFRPKFSECSYCGKKYETKIMTVDHIIPLARGGKHSCDNLAICCFSCNAAKGIKIIGVEYFPMTGFGISACVTLV